MNGTLDLRIVSSVALLVGEVLGLCECEASKKTISATQHDCLFEIGRDFSRLLIWPVDRRIISHQSMTRLERAGQTLDSARTSRRTSGWLLVHTYISNW